MEIIFIRLALAFELGPRVHLLNKVCVSPDNSQTFILDISINYAARKCPRRDALVPKLQASTIIIQILFFPSIKNTWKMFFSLSPFAPENLVSRDGFGSPVPRQPTYLGCIWCLLTGFLPSSAAASIYLFVVPSWYLGEVSVSLS